MGGEERGRVGAEGEVVREAEFGVTCFERGGRGHKPKLQTAAAREAAKSRYVDSPLRACRQEEPVLYILEFSS